MVKNWKRNEIDRSGRKENWISLDKKKKKSIFRRKKITKMTKKDSRIGINKKSKSINFHHMENRDLRKFFTSLYIFFS